MEYMEAQMQRRFDAWDAQMAAAAADLKAYTANLLANNVDCMLAIEEAWGLGYLPPAVVSEVLHAVAGGKSVDAALDEALGASGEKPSPAPNDTASDSHAEASAALLGSSKISSTDSGRAE